MTKKRWQRDRETCGRKQQYANGLDAMAAAQRINTRGKSKRPVLPYQCRACGKWHLGGIGPHANPRS